jgi:hypothetical protein
MYKYRHSAGATAAALPATAIINPVGDCPTMYIFSDRGAGGTPRIAGMRPDKLQSW